MTTFLHTCIPFAPDLNLGRAYNVVMEALPAHGWACLLDHDVMFTTNYWHSQLLNAIAQRPEGTFVACANRVGPDGSRVGWQRVENVNPLVHDIALHREVGRRMAETPTLRDITDEAKPFSGFLMCVSKATWQAIGGFREGFRYVDYGFTLDLRRAGRRVYLIEGLYLYHWRRADGAKSPKGALAITPEEYQAIKLQVLKSKEVA